MPGLYHVLSDIKQNGMCNEISRGDQYPTNNQPSKLSAEKRCQQVRNPTYDHVDD
ncbi:hypothetical protein [Mucilaginibacter jinjuensis]|uniref:Uncharacterized protein n=1 Tax=Mucilaginibacter jinjuensis TaxID=1176721 RepID=A0ABY7T9S8_9SPHI|nr:hypothetical protein [Mucilaginibacter jinjuensis]WCT13250.1 hypothetical protein PQO05_04810 [Mucilaginibacter jinjuensis]